MPREEASVSKSTGCCACAQGRHLAEEAYLRHAAATLSWRDALTSCRNRAIVLAYCDCSMEGHEEGTNTKLSISFVHCSAAPNLSSQLEHEHTRVARTFMCHRRWKQEAKRAKATSRPCMRAMTRLWILTRYALRYHAHAGDVRIGSTHFARRMIARMLVRQSHAIAKPATRRV